MDSIAVKIMIHGLIALAPSANTNDTNHITALVLDARMPHGAECVTEHRPRLLFHVVKTPESMGNCARAGCELNEDECVCTDSLSRKKIWLQLTPPILLSSTQAAGTNPLAESLSEEEEIVNAQGLPPSGEASGDLFYLANLTKSPFDAKLNMEYLAPDPKVSNLFARMEVPFTRLTACSLAKREDRGKFYVLPLSFRALRARSSENDKFQAVAQMVLARFDIDQDREIDLYISDFNGDSPLAMRLARGAHGYMINLSNEPDELERGDACDDGVARHFAHFYEFAEDPPAWSDRLIPHVRFVSGLEASQAQHPECLDPTFDFMDRPICPMASFLP